MRLPRWARPALIVLVALAAGCDGLVKQAGSETPDLPDPKEQTRALWSRAAGGFLRTWLVCGEFPNPPHEGKAQYDHTPPCVGFETDYLADAGGEAVLEPTPGMVHKRPDGTDAAWVEHTAPRRVVDFTKLFPGRPTTNVVAYAWTTVDWDADGEAVLAVGSDDGVRIWVNGTLVHDHLVARGVRADQDVVPVRLRKGPNRLMVKVEQGGGGWGFTLRVLTKAQAIALEMGEMRPEIQAAPADKPHQLVVHTDPTRKKPTEQAVYVLAIAPGGDVVGYAEAKRGEAARFDTAKWAAGPYEVRISSLEPDGRRIFRHIPWYKGDWQKQVHELLDACDKVGERPTDPAGIRCRMLAALIVDRLGGDPRQVPKEGEKKLTLGPDDWKKIHPSLLEHRETTLGDAAAIRAHGFLRLAWRDPVDDSPQFARAYLPADYDAARKWPMVVVLHGYNPPNPLYIHWWGVTNRYNWLAQRHNVVVLEPHGRGNANYRGIGDADVVRAIALAKRKFSIDADRVYLTGYSMGGGGTWHVGTRHPGLFAAIAPIYGGWDYHVWSDPEDFAELTPRECFERESWSSFAQAEALLNTPVFVNHGDSDDLVDIEHSRYAVRMLQRWGYKIRYWEHPGKGHGGLGCEDTLIGWFLRHRRDANPRHVRVRAPRLRSASAHWVRIEQREDPFALIHADVQVADPHTIRVETQNVLQIRLAPGEPLVDRKQPVRVLWNGADAGAHTFADGAITLRAEGYTPGALHKTPAIEGPINDVQTTPYAIVVGTASADPRMARFCRVRAEAARLEWETWQHVSPRFLLDTEITDEQIRTLSLILFGGPDENLVTRKLIGKLPLAIEPDAITIGGERFAATDAAVAIVYPHPLNPERYVCVRAANSPDAMFRADELPDHLDFAIADGRLAPDDDTPGEKLWVAAGRFDHGWQLDETLVTRGDPETRARAAVRKAPTLLSAATDAPSLQLSDVLETTSAGSFTRMMRDLNWHGKPIRLGGRTYRRGVGLSVWHQPCIATYDLTGAAWTHLRATIGIEIDDPAELEPKHKDGTRVYFVVRGDGKQLYRSPTFRWNSGPVEMDVDVTGVGTLELEVANEVTWFNAASSVDWAELRLEK